MTLEPLAPLDGDAVLSLEDAKAFLRVDGEDENEVVGALRDAAVDWVERYTAKGLTRRAWVWTGAGFDTAMRLPFGPVAGVSAISYRDAAGAIVALDPADWLVAGGAVQRAGGYCWPVMRRAPGAVSVTFTAGYEDAARDAPALVSAVKLLLGNLYSNRSAVVVGTISSELPFAVTALCQAYRVPVIG